MIKKIFIAAALLISSASFAQMKGEDPQSYLTYSLPMTTITLEVEAVQEKFYAGPYAKYAEKYLGIKPRQEDETLFQLTQVKMTPYVEADQSRRYSVNVPAGKIENTFMKLAAGGFISFADANFGSESIWRFTTRTEGDFLRALIPFERLLLIKIGIVSADFFIKSATPLFTAIRRRSLHMTRCLSSRIWLWRSLRKRELPRLRT